MLEVMVSKEEVDAGGEAILEQELLCERKDLRDEVGLVTELRSTPYSTYTPWSSSVITSLSHQTSSF